MSLCFPRVPEVVAGEPVSSDNLARLARSVAKRMRSGVGDAAERIYYGLSSASRSITCPVGDIYPAWDEWLGGLHLVDPTSDTWPAALPGDEGGINEMAPIAAFVFGNHEACNAADYGTDDEENRLLGVDPMLTSTATLEDVWILHKGNRGQVDPDTNEMAAPALAAADASAGITYPRYGSIWGNRYGGWHPAPVLVDYCSDGITPSYQHFFTSLKDPPESTVTYPGSCYDTEGHALIYEGEDFYVAMVYSSGTYTPTVFWKNEWIEGPYNDGGVLQRRSAGHWGWMMHNFAREFRGSAEQRGMGDGYDATRFGVAFETFLRTQYYMAPSIGVASDGESPGERVVEEVYPLFRLAAGVGNRVESETLAVHTQSGTTEHTIHEGYVFSGAFLKATGLVGTATVAIESSGVVVATVTLNAAESDGMAIKMIGAPERSAPLRVRAVTAIQFEDGDGKIDVECLEQVAMKPRWPKDGYVWLRLATASSGTPDGVGELESQALEVSEQYFATGGFLNINGAPGPMRPLTEINTNGPLDAWRRLSQCVRVVPGASIKGYALDEQGRSVVWFDRMVTVQGAEVDLWSGIGPEIEAISSGDVEWGIEYVVRDGAVIYDGVEYGDGDLFTGESGVAEFEGTGSVYEHDGIRHVAPPKGFTNEWIGNAYFKVGTNEGTVFSFDEYGKKYTWVNRCHMASGETHYIGDLVWHMSYGMDPPLMPEAVSALNYSHGTNRIGGYYWHFNDEDQIEFYRSCQVHNPWPEIESAVMDGDELKVTFKTRIQHTDDAPATIARDVSTWNKAALATEGQIAGGSRGQRSMENGIREYLVLNDDGTPCSRKNGDTAASSSFYSDGTIEAESVDGACQPHLILVQLPEVPYEDEDDNGSAWDTRTWHDQLTKLWLYVSMMVEGYVDKTKTQAALTDSEYGCRAGPDWIMEYTFENACFEAFGNAYPTPLPAELVPENPRGYGPLPRSEYYAETFNQLVKVVNLLNRVRLDMGINLVSRYKNFTDQMEWPVSWPADVDCTAWPTGQAAVFLRDAQNPWPMATTPSGPGLPANEYWSDWETNVTMQAATEAMMNKSSCGDDGAFLLISSRTILEYKVEPIHEDQLEAVPEELRDLVTNQSLEFLANIQREVTTTTAEEVSSSEDASGCDDGTAPAYWDPFEGKGYSLPIDHEITNECAVLSAGQFDLGAPPAGDLSVCRVSGDEGGRAAARTLQVIPIDGANAAIIVVPLSDDE